MFCRSKGSRIKYRTLFLGVPLPSRSKHGREVTPAAQATVNKLESFGYPVQRYRSDRAKKAPNRDSAFVAEIARGPCDQYTGGSSVGESG